VARPTGNGLTVAESDDVVRESDTHTVCLRKNVVEA
jgi:hypothetical protein